VNAESKFGDGAMGSLDHLFLDTIGFPKGHALRSPTAQSDYRWEVEIHCDESPQLDYRKWADDRPHG
jgi:hypothetical protein